MIYLILSLTLLINGMKRGEIPEFGKRENLGEVENNSLDEASGLASSMRNKDVLWTHNDSGDENRIFALGLNGSNKGEYYLQGAENRDWEDIATGPGPETGKYYIYIGEIGDNDAKNDIKYIYRVEEPLIDEDQFDIRDTLLNVSKISFYYPDGNRDAETLLVDPISRDIFIIGKRDSDIRLYRLPFPQSTSVEIAAELSEILSFPADPGINIPHNYITSGDITADGTEIIVKTYSNIYYWNREPGKSIAETLSENIPVNLPFVKSVDETQGEAVCWNYYDDIGFFTLAEEKVFINGFEFNFPAQLYYYPRVNPSSVSENENYSFRLKQNFPNPFNPSTNIEYYLPENQYVKLIVYDKTGEEIVVLVDGYQLEGHYSIKFDIFSLDIKLSSGIYYYSLIYGGKRETKSMVLIK